MDFHVSSVNRPAFKADVFLVLIEASFIELQPVDFLAHPVVQSVVSVEIRLEEQEVDVEASGPNLPGFRLHFVQNPGKQGTVFLAADIQGILSSGLFAVDGQHTRYGIDFIQHLGPGLQLHPAAGGSIGHDARDECRNDACAPLEQIRSRQGIDECAFPRFDRPHDGDSQELVLEGRPDVVEVNPPPRRGFILHQFQLLEFLDRLFKNLHPLFDLPLELQIFAHDPPLSPRSGDSHPVPCTKSALISLSRITYSEKHEKCKRRKENVDIPSLIDSPPCCFYNLFFKAARKPSQTTGYFMGSGSPGASGRFEITDV